MRVLFIGDSWKGSSARSFREVLSSLPGIQVDDIGLDHYILKGKSVILRTANRLLAPWQQAEIADEIARKIKHFEPDVMLVAKGAMVGRDSIRAARNAGVLTVNRFPDCSPHAHGQRLREAIGEYDLILSTKTYHPPNWNTVYGYDNRCVCIPHGYSPHTHYSDRPSDQQDIDVVWIASWRPQYAELLLELSRELDTDSMSVLVAGAGWEREQHKFPRHWQFPGGVVGRAYSTTLRRGKIVIAPVHTEMSVEGKSQPGDQDTARTYELAAAYCFFLHCRTPFVQTLYSETDEVPMWSNAKELAELIQRFLPLPALRLRMAAAAHRRAVPAYSLNARVEAAVAVMLEQLNGG